jgi:dipeptidyl aminopeptidase/acylaminoacyl peptidase
MPTALFLSLLLSALIAGCSRDEGPQTASSDAGATRADAAKETQPADADLAEQVARMGAIGYSTGGTFSPDGERVAFVSNSSGVPNVWVADADGGNLAQLTRSDNQVDGVDWSPAGDTLAVEIAPGGGLNTQIYLLPTSGEELRMITEGGKVNNWLTGWSDDGRFVRFSSSVGSANGMDCWLHDTETGENRLIVANRGIGYCVLSPDNSRVLAWRMVSRGMRCSHPTCAARPASERRSSISTTARCALTASRTLSRR